MIAVNLTKSSKKFMVVLPSDSFRKDLSQNKVSSTQLIQLNREESPMISFSQEARKKLLEDRNAEIKEKAQQMIEGMREQSRRIQEMDRSKKKEALAQKIADTKQRLKALVEMMRSALLFGDKRAAAVIAKEAARLAKELAVALKEAGAQDSGGDISIPELSLAGASEKTDGAENTENIENIDTGAAEQVAAAEAAVKELNGTISEDAADPDGLGNSKESIKELAKEKLDEARETRNGSGIDNELKIIIAMLKSIASMARATAKQKKHPAISLPQNPHTESKNVEETEKAAAEIEKAVAEIQVAMSAIPAK